MDAVAIDLRAAQQREQRRRHALISWAKHVGLTPVRVLGEDVECDLPGEGRMLVTGAALRLMGPGDGAAVEAATMAAFIDEPSDEPPPLDASADDHWGGGTDGEV